MNEEAGNIAAPMANAPRGSRRARREEITMRIERTTLSLMLQHDAETLTMDSIAQAVGLSRRSVYRYVKSTEDVVYRIICRIADHWIGILRHYPLDEALPNSIYAANFVAGKEAPDRSLQEMTAQVLIRYPDLVVRLSGPVQSYFAERGIDLILARLPQRYREPALADAIARGLVAIIFRLLENAARENKSMRLEDVAHALKAFGALFDRPRPDPDTT